MLTRSLELQVLPGRRDDLHHLPADHKDPEELQAGDVNDSLNIMHTTYKPSGCCGGCFQFNTNEANTFRGFDNKLNKQTDLLR